MIPATCQSENSSRPAVDLAAKAGCGRSHRLLRTKRCVRSKFDTPRLARLSSWLPSIGPESMPAAPKTPPEPLSIDLAYVYEARNCSPRESRLVALIWSEL